jgi:VanZ family protein
MCCSEESRKLLKTNLSRLARRVFSKELSPIFGRLGISGRLICWLLTLSWAATIFYFSTASFGSSTSESILTTAFADIDVIVSSPTVDILDSLSRTLAHLTEYGILGILLYASFRHADEDLWQPGVAGRSVAIAAVYALTDEFHQAFVPGRHASLLDSGLDTLGSALSVSIIYLCWRWSRRKRCKHS